MSFENAERRSSSLDQRETAFVVTRLDHLAAPGVTDRGVAACQRLA